MDFSTTQLNNKFLEMLEDPEMRKEAQLQGAQYLKAQIYEDSFMEKILPPQTISPKDCDRDERDTTVLKRVIDKEFTDVKAVATTFRGMDEYEYVETDAYAVNFYKIDSEEYEITEEELRAKQQPVQKLIRHHVAFQIRKAMDRHFKGMCEYAIRLPNGSLKTETNVDSYNTANGTNYTPQVIDLSNQGPQIVTPELITQLRNLLDARQPEYLEASTLLMTKSMFNNIDTWVQSNTQAGANTAPGMAGGITDDFWKDGYKYDTLFGLRVVVTRKTDILSDNEIFCFPDPEYIGHHFTFNDDRFAIEKKWSTMKWKGWRSHGAAIGNEYAPVKMILDT